MASPRFFKSSNRSKILFLVVLGLWGSAFTAEAEESCSKFFLGSILTNFESEATSKLDGAVSVLFADFFSSDRTTNWNYLASRMSEIVSPTCSSLELDPAARIGESKNLLELAFTNSAEQELKMFTHWMAGHLYGRVWLVHQLSHLRAIKKQSESVYSPFGIPIRVSSLSEEFSPNRIIQQESEGYGYEYSLLKGVFTVEDLQKLQSELDGKDTLVSERILRNYGYLKGSTLFLSTGEHVPQNLRPAMQSAMGDLILKNLDERFVRDLRDSLTLSKEEYILKRLTRHERQIKADKIALNLGKAILWPLILLSYARMFGFN